MICLLGMCPFTWPYMYEFFFFNSKSSILFGRVATAVNIYLRLEIGKAFLPLGLKCRGSVDLINSWIGFEVGIL